MSLHSISKCAFSLVFVFVASVTFAQVGEDPIQGLLDAKDFAQARDAAKESPNGDQLLGRVALAQFEAGSAADAKDTLRLIQDGGALTNAASQIQQAAGGGTGADFDTLIDLITNTVAPNSWSDVGGAGSIESFPGGVAVDADGVLRMAKVAEGKQRQDLNLLREKARNFEPGDPRRDSKRRMVSLTRLERELKLNAALGQTPSESMKHLAGLREVRYLFLFPETNDVVIAGPAGDWSTNERGVAVGDGHPVLLLDDLVTLLRNATEGGSRFSCSITPKRENLAATKQFLAQPTGKLKPRQTPRWVDDIRETLGLQDIEIRGIDPRSHVAHVLVEADYHMKLVGMGLEPSVPGVSGYLESIKADEIPRTMDVLRWWFTLRKNSIRRNEDGNAFVFAKQCVKLQSENELVTEAGDRLHTGRSSELNQQFANQFTEHYGRMAREYPVYAQLQSLFQLSLVAAVLQSDEVRSQLDWNTDWLTSSVTTAQGNTPEEVPSIVNHRVINKRHVVVGVSGGVTVDARPVVRSVRTYADGGRMQSDQNSAEPRTPASSAKWWWD